MYSDQAQQSKILELIGEYQILLKDEGYGDIQTIVKPLSKFFVAENYHQDYIKKNPNGYCPDHSTGIKFVRNDYEPKKDNNLLKIGKSIVVIEPEAFLSILPKIS